MEADNASLARVVNYLPTRKLLSVNIVEKIKTRLLCIPHVLHKSYCFRGNKQKSAKAFQGTDAIQRPSIFKFVCVYKLNLILPLSSRYSVYRLTQI
jgi:hypothetical protein